MIKRTTLKDGIFYKVFTKYIASNGKFICAVNDVMVTPEEGNALYLKLKEDGAVCTEREMLNTSDSDIIESIESQIDRYTEYIENYDQQVIAQEKNRKMYELLTAFKAILS